MKQRYTIAYKGLGAGTHLFGFEIRDDFFERREGSGIKGGSVDVEVALERKGSSLALRTAMQGAVTVECDRCLEDCRLPVGFNGRLTVKFSDEEVPFDGEVLWINPADSLLDLEQYIYESIVLSLPYRRIHPEDVHGTPLCNPAMLDRFRIVSEEEFAGLTAQKPAEQDPRWEKLRGLRDEHEREKTGRTEKQR